MYDYAFWNEIDYEAKWKLTGLYGPYLVIGGSPILISIVDEAGDTDKKSGREER